MEPLPPELSIIVIAFEVAGEPVRQGPAFDVIMQVMTSPFVQAALVYIELFVPTFELLSSHWYEGEVPPLVGVAVNVTLVVPEQIGLFEAAIVTLAETFGLTIIMIELDVAGEPFTTHDELEVITLLITSPLVGA